MVKCGGGLVGVQDLRRGADGGRPRSRWSSVHESGLDFDSSSDLDFGHRPPKVVKTIIRESVGSTQWPMLTKTNFME